MDRGGGGGGGGGRGCELWVLREANYENFGRGRVGGLGCRVGVLGNTWAAVLFGDGYGI